VPRARNAQKPVNRAAAVRPPAPADAAPAGDADDLPWPDQSPQQDGTAAEGNRVRRTLAVGAVLLLLLWAAVGALAWQERERRLVSATERAELLAQVFADSVTRSVESAAQAAATLAGLIERGLAPDSGELRAVLRQTLVNLPYLRGLGVIDAQGMVLASAEPRDLQRVIDLTRLGPLPRYGFDRLGPWVAARGLGDLAGPAADAHVPPPGVGFLPLLHGVQLRNGQRVWLVTMISADAFVNRQQVTMNDAAAAAALLTYEGRFITATPDVEHATDAALATLAPFSVFLPAREHGSWRGQGLRPGTQIGAFRLSASRPLAMLVEVHEQAVLSGWRQGLRPLLATALAVSLVIVAMTTVAARSVHGRDQARRALHAAQADVARRERALSITVTSVQELIFRTDSAGRVRFANARWAGVTGTDAAAALGRPFAHWVAAEQRDAACALFKASEGPGWRRASLRINDVAGLYRQYDVAVMPLLRGGQCHGYAGSAVDVTERVHAQQLLQGQVAFTAQLLELSPLPNSVVDSSRRYVLVNRAWEDFTGRRRADVVGRRVGEHLNAEERRVHEAEDAKLLTSGQPLRYEATTRHRDGSLRDVVVHKLLLPGEGEGEVRVLTVLQDVSEFRRAERATRDARDAAEESSRAKSEFIANMSHELRTPLQSIIGFSELGRMRGRDQPRLAAMFDDIHAAGHRMLSLVNDLLDVAKIESAVGTIHLERCDLRALVREVCKELAPLLARREQHLNLKLPESVLLGKVDPLRFQQVVRNLLANAIRFSPSGGRIDVLARHTDIGELELSVADRGPGIPAAELEAIFSAFVQSSQTKDGSGGTGLGLAICRTIIDAHGGRIHAHNRDGGGAVFVVVLPARAGGETLPAPLDL
jgi:PAS domain S-box-containing protein